MNAEEARQARTIGLAIWRVRDARRKGLRVIAGLAGMGKDTLQKIENGERSPTLGEIQALAKALEISVADLTRLPVPAPANGHVDSAIEAVRLALHAIEAGYPDGVVLPVAVLADQVAQIHRRRRDCQFTEVATDLPGLIRSLHTTLATGADHAELLDLAVYLHVHVTRQWLAYAAAPADLISRTVFLAQRLAWERGDIAMLGLAGLGVADTLLAGGAFQLGQTMLDSLTLPPTTADTAGLLCQLTMCHAQAAVLDGHPDDATAAMDTVTELAGRFGSTGEADSLGIVFSPMHAGLCRMWLALETDEPDQVVRIGQDLHPERHPFKEVQAWYWVDQGRALARLRKRNDAVMALRTAEDIFPTKVLRDPFVRDTLAVLLPGARRDTVGEELRSMARRAGLPV